MNRTKEQFVPRQNYITLTCERTGDLSPVYDPNANISEYQTVLNVGPHVHDLKKGDKVKFERTAFPSKEEYINPNFNDDIAKLSEDIQAKLDKLDKAKGKAADKQAKKELLRIEFQDKVEELKKTAKVFTIPVYKDDTGEQFLWMADRAVMFKFED